MSFIHTLGAEMEKYDPTSEEFVIARNRRTAYQRYENGEVDEEGLVYLLTKGSPPQEVIDYINGDS